eukprot:bmy_10520T0
MKGSSRQAAVEPGSLEAWKPGAARRRPLPLVPGPWLARGRRGARERISFVSTARARAGSADVLAAAAAAAANPGTRPRRACPGLRRPRVRLRAVARACTVPAGPRTENIRTPLCVLGRPPEPHRPRPGGQPLLAERRTGGHVTRAIPESAAPPPGTKPGPPSALLRGGSCHLGSSTQIPSLSLITRFAFSEFFDIRISRASLGRGGVVTEEANPPLPFCQPLGRRSQTHRFPKTLSFRRPLPSCR